jgi:hypothetical protein
MGGAIPGIDRNKLRALTLIQPWAWAFGHAGKWIENRTWTPPTWLIGEPLAIHAGKKVDVEAVADLRFDGHSVPEMHKIDRGAIVVVARLIGWVRWPPEWRPPRSPADEALLSRTPEEEFFGVAPSRARLALKSQWWAGPVGWIFEDVVAIPPVPILGSQGLWAVPPAVADVVSERWEEARR